MSDDSKSILPAGIHHMTLAEFGLKFVDQFPQSVRRKLIFDKFSQYLNIILNLDIVTELWLNGSFVTEKSEPGDIDAVAFFDVHKANSLILDNASKSCILDIPRIQSKYLTDIRFVRNDDQSQRSYWRGWYGFSRDEQPKGFVCLKLEN
jgi:hypothetical protein